MNTILETSSGSSSYITATINLSTWHHIVYTIDNTNNVWHIYLDGNLISTVSFSGSSDVFSTMNMGMHTQNMNTVHYPEGYRTGDAHILCIKYALLKGIAWGRRA